jgi:glucokinase
MLIATDDWLRTPLERTTMQKPPYYVGLDVGGTSMKGGVVDDHGQAFPSVSLPTEAHRGQEFGLERMCETIRAAIESAKLTLKDIAAIGVATPGTMDIPAGVILDPPNLKPWRNVPVRDHIAKVFQKPTAFQNDANAAALGEHWAGAGKGVHSMVLFTLGTGVGGGIVWGGEVIEGEHSHGAELGHMKIEMTRPRQCGCGRWGCLEAYASATSVVKRTLDALTDAPSPSSLARYVKTPDELTAKVIFDAAAAGDALAQTIVDETAYYLAVGTTNMLHTVDPNMVVFTGGMIAAGESFLERIRKYVKELAFPVPAAKAQLRYALLGSDAGFIGAAGCARLLMAKSG